MHPAVLVLQRLVYCGSGAIICRDRTRMKWLCPIKKGLLQVLDVKMQNEYNLRHRNHCFTETNLIFSYPQVTGASLSHSTT